MVIGMKATIFLIWIITLSVTCQKEKGKYPIDMSSLTYFQNGNYNGQFSITGYYSYRQDNDIFISYFFEDGTFCTFGDNIENTQLNNICPEIENIREIPYYWGAYIIEGDTLKIQKFHPYRGTFEKFEVEEILGKIENDTTIRYCRKLLPDGEEQTLNERYDYSECYNKPDSTNVLMKY